MTQTKDARIFAIVPAAGVSSRMGRPKLLLPWPTERRPQGLLIDCVLEAWSASEVDDTIVVVRCDDEALRLACQAWPVTVVCPDDDPQDMKASIQVGFRHLESVQFANDDDSCFVAPADLPGLASDLVNDLLDCERKLPRAGRQIVVPRFGQKIGHPALLPWAILREIFELSDEEGVNQIVARHEKHAVPFAAELAFDDIDTPKEYEIARKLNR